MLKSKNANPAIKSGIGIQVPTFVQNGFTPWCLKLIIYLEIWYDMGHNL